MSAMTFCDIDGDGRKELLVRSAGVGQYVVPGISCWCWGWAVRSDWCKCDPVWLDRCDNE